MGDAGSLFVGFMLACLTALEKPSAAHSERFGQLLAMVSIPVLILFIPILDTGFVSLMRKLFQRPISQGGKDHSSHRMVAIGFSERKSVLVLYGFSVVSGLIALGLNRLRVGTALVVMILYLLGVLFFWIYLGRVKVYPESVPPQVPAGGKGLFPLLAGMTQRRKLLEVVLDLVLITLAYYISYLLRFEGDPAGNFDFFLKSLPIVIACQILCFHLFGVYRGVWVATGVRDLIVYIKAITLATVLVILLLLFVYRFVSFSRAVFVIYWGLMLIMTSLSRLSFRLLDEGVRRTNQQGRPALIYGAGIGGQMLIKEIETDRESGLKLVGFVDDNPQMHRRKLKGYPILGGQADLKWIIPKYGIQEIIVSFRERGAEKKAEVSATCAHAAPAVAVRQMILTIR
jgi:UDP-GlcNAc:undecaprenyl-phosphate/decaprenyl-phosphate GlcNAc-1-phosphate transferase